MTLSIMDIFVTLGQTTFSIMALSLMTFVLTALNLTIKNAPLSITTLSIMGPDTLMLSIVRLSVPNKPSVVIQNVIKLSVMAPVRGQCYKHVYDCNLLRGSLRSRFYLAMDKHKLAGQNLGRVFNSRLGRAYI